ncbi:unnamed protein product [Cyprideis torosa]|uniref:PA domain-containing protein n=1 Tax=Cyprideis torosa TaxID=163714 RepID=A0A7R8WMX6_9CRUS|nr:unnamed protein product [Cyprideis torosa]CAG0905706.1 unnamed protein product [Cyprideis torosa]
MTCHCEDIPSSISERRNPFIRGIFLVISQLLVFIGGSGGIEPRLDMYTGVRNVDRIDDDMFFQILEPESLRYTYKLRPAKNFGEQFKCCWNGIPLVPADPMDLCEDALNPDELNGRLALVQRGSCPFALKVVNAERAGAVGVIVSDIVSSELADVYIEMIVDDDKYDPRIPAAYLPGVNGRMILNRLHESHRTYALVNIPVNLTNVPLEKWKQPPWQAW